jgi:hypothetical protein
MVFYMKQSSLATIWKLESITVMGHPNTGHHSKTENKMANPTGFFSVYTSLHPFMYKEKISFI